MRALGDWLAPLLVALLASQPLWSNQLVQGADALLHYYRVIALSEMWAGGDLYSRWFPNLAFGYGYPIFNFYAPLSHLIAGLLHVAGFDFVGSIHATFVLAFCLASAGMWYWLRQWLPAWPALTGAGAYVFAPYTLYNVTERAALAESMALAFMTWCLALVRRQAHGHSRFTFGALVCATAGVILSHNITALTALPAVVAYAVLLCLGQSGAKKLRALIQMGTPIALGVAATTFFWLPALSERDLTNLEIALSTAYDFRAHFVDPVVLLSLPQPFDPNKLNNAIPTSIGLASLAMAMIGVFASVLRTSKLPGADVTFAAIIFLAYSGMTHRISEPVWNTLPLIHFVEFPWRMLGMGSMGLAVLAAAGVGAANRSTKYAWMTGITALVLLVIHGWAWQTPRHHTVLQSDPESIAQVERRLGIVGTTSIGEYVPASVRTLPGRDAPRGNKLLPERGDPLADIQVLNLRAIDWRYEIDSPVPHTVTWAQFMFEGWAAGLNGVPIALQTGQDGMMQAVLPAGRFDLHVWYGSNALRNFSNIASAAAGVLSMVAVIGIKSRRAGSRSSFDRIAILPLVIMVSGLFLLKTAVVDTGQSGIKTNLLPARLAPPLTFEEKIRLLATDEPIYLSDKHAVKVGLYWGPGMRESGDISVGAKIVDAQGATVGQHDAVHPAGAYPSSRWAANDYVHDVHLVTLEPGSPPGQYEVRAFAYPRGQPDSRLSVDHAAGSLEAPAGTVLVQRPAVAVDRSTLKPQMQFAHTFGSQVTLVGADVPIRTINRGNFLPVDLYWHALKKPDAVAEGKLCFRLGEANAGCNDLVPGYPIERWELNDVWRATHRVRVPVDIPPGETALVFTVAGEQIILPQILVTP